MTKLQTINLLKELQNSDKITSQWKMHIRKLNSTAGLWEIYFVHRELDPCLVHFFLKEESVNTIAYKINFERRALESPDDNTLGAWNLQSPFLLDTPECPNQKEFVKTKITTEEVIALLDKYVVQFIKDLETTSKAQEVLNKSWSVINNLKLKGTTVTKNGDVYSGKVDKQGKSVDFEIQLNKGEFKCTYSLTGMEAVNIINEVVAL